jgi:hypothetical protein
MNKKRLLSIPVDGNGCTHVEVELYYSKGGMNYFSGRNEARGLWLSVSPVERGDRFVKYSAWSGIKKHVKEMKMFSQKAIDTFTPNEMEIEEMINTVISNNSLRRLSNPEFVQLERG